MAIVDVIVVTYNSSATIERCLSPLASHPEVNIVVYDNASTDNTLEVLASFAGNVVVLEGTTNLGFARAVNLAASKCSGDVIVLLNPDARIDLDTVRQLVQEAGEAGRGAVGPSIELAEDRRKISSAGYMPTTWRMFCHLSGLSRLGLYLLRGHYLIRDNLGRGPIEVDWITGACLALRREIFALVGGLDERWFMYAEDIELCRRLQGAGFTNVLLPSLACEHVLGSSHDPGVLGNINTLWLENLFDLYTHRLARSRVHSLAWAVVVAGGYSARAAACCFLALFAHGEWRHREAKRFLAYAGAPLRQLPRVLRRPEKERALAPANQSWEPLIR